MHYKYTEKLTRPSLETRWVSPCVDHYHNPWKMIKLDNKPSWWDTNYGPGPYDSSNKCWTDISEGKIIDGDSKGQYDNLRQPFILDTIKEWELILEYQSAGKILEISEEGYETLERTLTIKFLDTQSFYDFQENTATISESYSDEHHAQLGNKQILQEEDGFFAE